ncbi:FmdE family protein [Oceanisphaera avium]|uniref:FmdE family protein n=1 Tax=Oceanisphaera avium TaxID=1903694 RepID=UPI0018DF8839|nr:FmdE family protein [Oceanisphaera avium]
MLEYCYLDAVRLAGHSCPTVAGAWLCTVAALKNLYGEQLPERGGVSVYMDEVEDAGVTGVIAQVVTLLTGATAANGFKGLAGRYARNNLLHYASEGVQGMVFRRNDTGQQVAVSLDLSSVPAEPAQHTLIPLILSGQATSEQEQEFGRLWQNRVQRLLLEHANDPEVVQVTALA